MFHYSNRFHWANQTRLSTALLTWSSSKHHKQCCRSGMQCSQKAAAIQLSSVYGLAKDTIHCYRCKQCCSHKVGEKAHGSWVTLAAAKADYEAAMQKLKGSSCHGSPKAAALTAALGLLTHVLQVIPVPTLCKFICAVNFAACFAPHASLDELVCQHKADLLLLCASSQCRRCTASKAMLSVSPCKHMTPMLSFLLNQ